MSEKFLLEDVKTGEQVELVVDYQKILDCPANGEITVKGKKYRKIGVSGNVIKDRLEADQVKNWDVTKRVSAAVGYHRDQVAEARKHVANLHPGIEIANNGEVVFGSRKARKVFLKSQGYRDNDAGYGD